MARRINTTVCIIGAGPGGAAAALTLAKAGHSCLLVDKAVFPRDKVCGDAISGKVVEVLKKIDPAIIGRFREQPFQLDAWGVIFVSPGLEKLRVAFKKSEQEQPDLSPGFIARRYDFDDFLVREVKRSDKVEVLEGVELHDFRLITNGFTASSRDGSVTVEAKLMIVANGAHSSFAKKIAGIHVEPRHYCAGIRAYYSGVEGLDHENFIELHFLKDLLPGYLWIFPMKNGYANIGLGMRSDHVSRRKLNLKEELMRIIETYPHVKERFKNARLDGKVMGFGLPLGSKRRKLSGERYMLVGDAASLIDPFTGEGIGNAVLSGHLAAKQAVECIKKNDYSARFLEQYDQEVHRKLWDELKHSSTLQKLVTFPWLFDFVVRKIKRNEEAQFILSCMFEDVELRKRFKEPSFYINLLLS